MFDQGPVLVATSATPEDSERHVVVRVAVADRIEGHERYRALLRSWEDDELRAIATAAARQFGDVVATSGSDPDDLVFYPGGIVGTLLHGSNVLDEPAPPEVTTVRIGPVVDRLLAGEATMQDLGDLLAQVDRRSDLTAIDARSPRPAGTASSFVEFDLSSAARAIRAPLETSLLELERRWEPDLRQVQAEELVSALNLGRWPWLASDLTRRYAATLELIIRGRPWGLEFRTGDPTGRGLEPPGLAIPAFVPTGDVVKDRARLARFQARFAEVGEVLERAGRKTALPGAKTRRAHRSEQAGYRRDAGWLFENIAAGTSLRKIAERDFGSTDRWKDVQRGVKRAHGYLDLADISWPPDLGQGDAVR